MSIDTKQYLWRFFGYYLACYLVGMAAIFIIDDLLKTNIRDIPLVVVLCIIIPTYICHKIIKNEGRFLDDIQRKRMVKKATLIAWIINSLPNIVYIGYCILLKMTVSSDDISSVLSNAQLSPDSSVASLLAIPIPYLLFMLFTMIGIYYAGIRLLIGMRFKRAAKQYKKLNGEVGILG
jgi:hypothetical protein